MWAAIAAARLGDAARGDDPTVAELERLACVMTGKDDALFLPSGTMANLAALIAHGCRGGEVIVEQQAHIYNAEGGGLSVLAGAVPRPIKGARGILVNITANASLTLGEYSQVGNIISEFASEQATVIVGTVIDESMAEEISVTVVATGLASAMEQIQPVPARMVVDNPPRVPRKVDYSTLDKPTATRRQAASRPEPQQSSGIYAKAVGAEADLEFLDIPAFLRRNQGN